MKRPFFAKKVTEKCQISKSRGARSPLSSLPTPVTWNSPCSKARWNKLSNGAIFSLQPIFRQIAIFAWHCITCPAYGVTDFLATAKQSMRRTQGIWISAHFAEKHVLKPDVFNIITPRDNSPHATLHRVTSSYRWCRVYARHTQSHTNNGFRSTRKLRHRCERSCECCPCSAKQVQERHW